MIQELAHKVETGELIYRNNIAQGPVRVVRNDLIQKTGERLVCRIWVRPLEGGALDVIERNANDIVFLEPQYIEYSAKL